MGQLCLWTREDVWWLIQWSTKNAGNGSPGKGMQEQSTITISIKFGITFMRVFNVVAFFLLHTPPFSPLSLTHCVASITLAVLLWVTFYEILKICLSRSLPVRWCCVCVHSDKTHQYGPLVTWWTMAEFSGHWIFRAKTRPAHSKRIMTRLGNIPPAAILDYISPEGVTNIQKNI